jgi:two-component system copper resistance phosphate regulon response regulator CusR
VRILLIEDEAVIAEAIQQGLEEAHHAVDWAPDGDTGLRLALDGGYALILLDLMLPGRDGWSICRTLRAHRDATPILMLTARDAIDDRVRGLDLGADDYLPKPLISTNCWRACGHCCGATPFTRAVSFASPTW